MTGEPLVSFVVPSYNYGAYVGQTIAAALAQDAPGPVEVVVIDDASTDDSVAVIEGFRGDGRVRFWRHARNQGHVATINEGFARARGRYVARIDSDDRHRPAFLRETLPVLERDPGVGLVFGDVALVDAAGRLEAERAPSLPGHPGGRLDALRPLLSRNFVPAPTTIGRREAWADALPIPAGLGFSDWYLSLWIARRWAFHYVPRTLADYRVHPASLHHRMIRDRSEEATVFRLLDRLLAEEPRLGGERAAVHAAQYRMLGDKYFGCGMTADARRCYLRALRLDPGRALGGGLPRRLAATFVGAAAYGRAKRWARAVTRPAARAGAAGSRLHRSIVDSP
jgi:glycosyltransferase involved in cell wall biosynthesis